MQDQAIQLVTDSPDMGVIIVDVSLRVLALDRGAAAILNFYGGPGHRREVTHSLPKELLAFLCNAKPEDLASLKGRIHIGTTEYVCSAYFVEPHNGSWCQPGLAIHLERAALANDGVFFIATRYHLTGREEEVLRGISIGLATKDLAKKLNISPNTVKAFLRLIMMKMAVTTRAEIFAKILDCRTRLEEAPRADATSGALADQSKSLRMKMRP
jgi:DNA-binding CsgD family transcriptional regulator